MWTTGPYNNMPAGVLTAVQGQAVDHNPTPSVAKPDLEWSINDFNKLRTTAGFEPVDLNAVVPWEMNIIAFAGSFQDDGIGEDFLPNVGDYATVFFPCQAFDACDVCGGNNSTCLDCANIPNGPNTYDRCDVCAGNGQSCLDCLGVANGPNVYDRCDVCAGNGQSCLDCRGIANGPNVYDRCNVCGGDGSTCLDCLGVPFGTNVYDRCNICAGNGQTCLDCRGVANGSARYDVCDVCAGDGSSCRDCAGTPNGPSRYDVCNVCGGDGQSCLDCQGTPFGSRRYDVCNVCGGDGRSCLDCAAQPFGSARYDQCDVCAGNGQSCLDCRGVPFGTSEYDVCDVCDGDGQDCLDVPPPRDPCIPRLSPKLHCGPFVGDVFAAELPRSINANDWSKEKVLFTAAEEGYMMMTGKPGVAYQRWLFDQPIKGDVLIYDLDQHANDDEHDNLTCGPNKAGRYRYVWEHDCGSVRLERIEDSCDDRRTMFSDLRIRVCLLLLSLIYCC
jgi:hypothetical protein